MPVITKIAQQKRRPNRRNIHLDGQFAFGCNVNVVARFRLREGLVLSDEQVQQIEIGEVKQEALDAVKKRVQEVFQRNMRHWSSIKKPAPAAFFENLLPYTADGYVRQAMVLTWMMMPRAGGRDFKDTRKIISRVFER